jgi:hypothetical protein
MERPACWHRICLFVHIVTSIVNVGVAFHHTQPWTSVL